MGAGLSTEHIRKTVEEKEPETRDENTSIAAKYYVNQILSLDEEALQEAWSKVCMCIPYAFVQLVLYCWCSRSGSLGLLESSRIHKFAGKGQYSLEHAFAVTRALKALYTVLQVSHASNVRSAGERDARLQYLSWRVWGMKRKMATVLQQQAAEIEQEDSDLSDVKSSDDQQVDAEDIAQLISGAPNLPRLSVKTRTSIAGDTASPTVEENDERDLLSPPETPGSPMYGLEQMQVTGDRLPKLYCVLISMHGLVRGEHMELGKDPDTGGQVRCCTSMTAAAAATNERCTCMLIAQPTL